MVLGGAAVIPWVLGVRAVYVVSAQYTGLGLMESYRAFYAGSNFGNGLWFVLWTGASGLTCWILSRKAAAGIGGARLSSYVLYYHGIPATLVQLPDTALAWAVSDVRAFTDSTAPYSPVVGFLVISGTIALTCAVFLSIFLSLSNRRDPGRGPLRSQGSATVPLRGSRQLVPRDPV